MLLLKIGKDYSTFAFEFLYQNREKRGHRENNKFAFSNYSHHSDTQIFTSLLTKEKSMSYIKFLCECFIDMLKFSEKCKYIIVFFK